MTDAPERAMLMENHERQESPMAVAAQKTRYHLPDSVRGLTLISMALYHAVWDMVYLFDEGWSWYQSPAAFLWQQSICWTFLLLSGFCLPMGRRGLRRGLTVLAASAAVTAVTVLFSPESRILFGVLTLKVEKLCNYNACGSIGNLFGKDNNSVIEKTGENIIGTFSSACLFYNIRN